MLYSLYVLNSFTVNNSGGNKAGVVFNSQYFSDDEMQRIAHKHQLSEIAFIKEVNQNTYSARYFTPNSEIEFCGHATIAIFGLLQQMEIINEGEYTLQTKVGEIKIIVNEEGILMAQNKPQFGEYICKCKVTETLNLSKEDLIDNLKCQMVSTGLFDIIVPIKDLETLNNLVPNFKAIKELSSEYNAVGYHLFAYDGEDIYTRNFAPLYDIDEESATGSASGALASYLYSNQMLNLNEHVNFKQGYKMKSPSEISVQLLGDTSIDAVMVGGKVGNYELIEESL